MPPPEPPREARSDLEIIGGRMGHHIGQLVAEETSRWSDQESSVCEALTKLGEMALAGGKRLRPAFAYWAFEGAGGDPEDPAILDAALALELLHTFALIHDDVMDQAVTRRSVETLHVSIAKQHSDRGWRGDPTRYGESIAVLMGDLAFAHAARLIARVPSAASEIFFTMCAEVMVGQFLDVESTANGGGERPVAHRVAELKTARYTIEGPLRIGAALAGGSAELDGHLRGYGIPLGHAFQLRDGLLGAFGDPRVTGKPVGDDLAQGKVTRLLEVALERCAEPEAQSLRRLGSLDLAAADIERARAALVSCGAVAEVEATISRLLDEAMEAIRPAPIRPRIRDILLEAAQLVTRRDR